MLFEMSAPWYLQSWLWVGPHRLVVSFTSRSNDSEPCFLSSVPVPSRSSQICLCRVCLCLLCFRVRPVKHLASLCWRPPV